MRRLRSRSGCLGEEYYEGASAEVTDAPRNYTLHGDSTQPNSQRTILVAGNATCISKVHALTFARLQLHAASVS